MISILLNVKDKDVLIVGGGKVAYRKARQYLNEEAKVTILSPSLDPLFQGLEINWIKDIYHQEYIEHYLLVYAATSSKDVNQQIIAYCQNNNILCGSATYDEDALFYSMSYKKHDVGTVALSLNQKLPYQKPIMKQFIDILDDNKERIQLLTLLRPYILKYIDNKQEYFERLYECDISILDFLYRSLVKHQGTIFIYHQSEYQEDIDFDVDVSIVFSLKQWKEYHDLLIFPIHYIIIPLVLYEGKVYDQIKEYIHDDWQDVGPLIYKKEDIQKILSLYKEENKQLLCIIHPRHTNQLMGSLKDILADNGEVYTFKDELILEKDKEYKLVIMLMTHGQHYHDFMCKIEELQRQGYHIECSGNLLDNDGVRKYIIGKL